MADRSQPRAVVLLKDEPDHRQLTVGQSSFAETVGQMLAEKWLRECRTKEPTVQGNITSELAQAKAGE